MTSKDRSHPITISISPETLERILFLAEREKIAVTDMVLKLLTESAEAEAGLARGPHLRKYMYR